tara:strand:- start:852 stop:2780 length:1929 start_codon:yes stop_codon:yes gene_type:complete
VSDLKWIFNPTLPDGGKSGGDLFAEKLQSSGFEPDELFIRETISNSADQRPEGSSSPVKIYVDVISLSGDSKERFKKAIDWKNLSLHAKASKIEDPRNPARQRLHSSLRKFNNSSDSVTLVKISDYGANGLIGDENDADSNFFLFAKAMMISSKSNQTQGSFGVGKGVLYHASNLRTVLMSSTILEDGVHKNRIFGRSLLPNHTCNEPGTEVWNSRQTWEGSGNFGNSDEGTIPTSLSVFDVDESLQENLFLNRDINLGTGTSAISIDYDTDHRGGPSAIVEGFHNDIKRWFWPALSQSHPEAEIFVREFSNHSCLTEGDGRVSLSEEWMPFANALTEEANSPRIINEGSIIQSNIVTKVPASTQGSLAYKGIGKIKILSSAITNHSYKNRLALLRKKLCVVKYLPITKPEELTGNLYGVYAAGKAMDNISENDESFHQFLRLAEPSLHDNWMYTPNIKVEYGLKAPRKFLQDHMKSIDVEIKQMLETDSAPSAANLDHISSKFQFGSKGAEVKPKAISFNFFDHRINNNLLEVTLEIRNLQKSYNQWEPICKLSILGQTSAKDNLIIKQVDILQPDNLKKIQTQLYKNTCLLKVDPEIQRFEIKLIGQMPKRLLEKNQQGKVINLEHINFKVDVTARELRV